MDTPCVPDTYEGGGELLVRSSAATRICLQLHFRSVKVVSLVIWMSVIIVKEGSNLHAMAETRFRGNLAKHGSDRLRQFG